MTRMMQFATASLQHHLGRHDTIVEHFNIQEQSAGKAHNLNHHFIRWLGFLFDVLPKGQKHHSIHYVRREIDWATNKEWHFFITFNVVFHIWPDKQQERASVMVAKIDRVRDDVWKTFVFFLYMTHYVVLKCGTNCVTHIFMLSGQMVSNKCG